MWVKQTRSSWFNCALRGDEAVYWISIGQQWLVLSQYEVDRVLRRYQMLIDVTGSLEGIMPLYIEIVEIGQVLPMPYSLTDFER